MVRRKGRSRYRSLPSSEASTATLPTSTTSSRKWAVEQQQQPNMGPYRVLVPKAARAAPGGCSLLLAATGLYWGRIWSLKYLSKERESFATFW